MLEFRLDVYANCSRDDLIEKLRRRSDANNRLLAALIDIAETHDARSELFTNDADCAATLADKARRAAYRNRGDRA